MPAGDQPIPIPPVVPRMQPRPLWWLLGIFLAAGGALVLYRFNPSQYGFYPRCSLYVITGLLCPGCGSQRALYQLVHGHVLLACRCNVLLMLALPWGIFQAARHAVARLRGNPPPCWVPRLIWIKYLVAVLIVFAILRNIPGEPFCYLAPP